MFTIEIPPSLVMDKGELDYYPHQIETAKALEMNDIVINDSETGTGKTNASLLYLKSMVNKFKGERYYTALFVTPVNVLLSQTFLDIRKFLKKNEMENDFIVFPLTGDTKKDLKKEMRKGRHGEDLNDQQVILRLFNDPTSMGSAISSVISRQPGVGDQSRTTRTRRTNYIIITNPDILYYSLFSKRYEWRKQDIHVGFLEHVKYIVFDEFHYYDLFQLVSFISLITFWKVSNQFNDTDGVKCCLLSATPNKELEEILEKTGARVAVVNNKMLEKDVDEKIPFVAPINLHVHDKGNKSFGKVMLEHPVEKTFTSYILDRKYGVVIGNSKRQVNNLHEHYDSLFPSINLTRITGSVNKEDREQAKNSQCPFCTNTTDVGYNFIRDEPHVTDRQTIDFLFMDFYTFDEFVQRLGRAGRVLHDDVKIKDIPSDVHVFFPSSTFKKIKERVESGYLDGKTRMEILSSFIDYIPRKSFGNKYFKEYGYFVSRLLVDSIRGYSGTRRFKEGIDERRDALFTSWENVLLNVFESSLKASNRLDMLHYHSKDEKYFSKIDDKRKINYLYHWFTDTSYRPIDQESGMEVAWRIINGDKSKDKITKMMRNTFIKTKDNKEYIDTDEHAEKKKESLKVYYQHVERYYHFCRAMFSDIIETFRSGSPLDFNVIANDPNEFESPSRKANLSIFHVINNYHYDIVNQGDDDHDPVITLKKKRQKYFPVLMKTRLNMTKERFDGKGKDNDDESEIHSYLWKLSWFEKRKVMIAVKSPKKMNGILENGFIGYIAPLAYKFLTRTKSIDLEITFMDGTKETYALFIGKDALEMRSMILGTELKN